MLIKTLITKSQKKQRNLICFSSPDSIVAEQFRTVRTNIQILLGEKENQKLLLTSPGIGEGKSTIIANLAVSLAQQKSKVLVIDANLRSPYIHSIFKFSNSDGLSSLLVGKSSFNEVVRYTGINGLDVLPGGPIPPNPAELIGSTEMKKLLSEISHEYDLILIDTPPILESAETRILSGICDGVILLLNRGKTQLDRAIQSKKVLQFANAKLIGVILNDR